MHCVFASISCALLMSLIDHFLSEQVSHRMSLECVVLESPSRVYSVWRIRVCDASYGLMKKSDGKHWNIFSATVCRAAKFCAEIQSCTRSSISVSNNHNCYGTQGFENNGEAFFDRSYYVEHWKYHGNAESVKNQETWVVYGNEKGDGRSRLFDYRLPAMRCSAPSLFVME